jgi:hypothetical protein
MKIDDIGGKQRLESPRETTRQGRTEHKKAFETLLEQEIGTDSDTAAILRDPSLVQGIPGMSNLLGSSLHPGLPAICERSLDGIKAMETSLSGLQASLDAASGDPRKIESIIQTLPKDVESIKSRLGDLSEGHPLKSVADEFEILAYVESIKWNRGDYL